MRVWLMSATVACALLAACGPHTPPAATQSQETARPEVKFLAAAVMYENFQIQAAGIAAAQGQSQAVKTYAANAAATHRATLQALTRAAQASGLPAPRADLNEDYRAYLDRLRGDDPAAPFDRRYVSQQTLLTMSTAGRYDSFATTGPDSPLKQWAATQTQNLHDQITATRQLARDAAAR